MLKESVVNQPFLASSGHCGLIKKIAYETILTCDRSL